MMEFLKENYDMVVLLVSMLGVLVAVIALFYEMKKKSNEKKQQSVSDEQQTDPVALGKDVLFERIKKNTQDKIKGILAVGAGAVIILLLNITGDYGVPLLWVVVLLYCVFDYWRNKRLLKLETPEQLVHGYDAFLVKEKVMNTILGVSILLLLGSLIYKMVSNADTDINNMGMAGYTILMVILIAGAIFVIYNIFKGKVRKNKDIERLRELIGEETDRGIE